MPANAGRALQLARAWGLYVLCGWAVESCGTDVCACSPALASATIHGRVTDETRAPVAQAEIRAYSGSASDCHSSQTDYGVILSAEDGRFLMGLGQAEAHDSVCVFTFARPPQAAAALTDSDTVLVVLDFRLGATPQDSAAIDLALRSR